MLGADGTAYGLCGFAVNQTYFSSHHAQPSGVNHQRRPVGQCGGAGYFKRSLLTYPQMASALSDELLTEKPLQEGANLLHQAELSFVGLSRPFMAADGTWNLMPDGADPQKRLR